MDNWEPGKPIDILLVEDSPGDIRLTREALLLSKINNRIHIAEDGVKALAMLRKEHPYNSVPDINLILLDLNLPRKDGREVLEDIRRDPHLTRIPVVILTTSGAEEDIFQAYQMQVKSYIIKPVDFKQFIDAIRSIDEFWLTIVKVPPK